MKIQSTIIAGQSGQQQSQPSPQRKHRSDQPASLLLCTLALLLAGSGLLHAANGTWSGPTNGTWNTTDTNWTGVSGTPWDITNGATNDAIFNTASLNNVVSGTVYTNGITFSTAGTVGGSGTITLAGTNPFITVTPSGFPYSRIDAVLAGTSGFTKTGAGDLVLGNANTLSGDITISQGSIRVGNGGAGDLGSVSNIYFGTTSSATAVKFNRSNDYTWNGNISSTVGDGNDMFNESGGNITLGGNLGTSSAYIGKFTIFSTGQVSMSGTNYIGISAQVIGVSLSAWNITGGQTTTKAGGLYVGHGSSSNAGQLNLSGSGQLIVAGNTIIRIGAAGNDGNSRNGASSLNISDTALFDTGTTTGVFRLGSNFASAAATDSGTINLNGGTLSTNRVITGGTVGDSTFNFNGGVFKATGTSATLSGLDTANIASGGAFIDTNGFNIAMSQVLSGSGALTKQGNGTLTLGGANTHTGATNVNVGTLLVSGTGSINNSSAITIASGATLNVSAAGLSILNGKSIGGAGVVIGNVSFSDGANFVFNLSNPLTVNSGTVSFANFGFSNLLGFDSSVANGTYNLITGTATIDFANIANFGVDNPYDLGSGRSAYFKEGSLQVVVIPEPSTYALIAISLTALVIFRRRRHTA